MEYGDEKPTRLAGPLLATAIACILIVFASDYPTTVNHAAPGGAFKYKSEADLVGRLIGSLLSGLVVWGICYVITIKRASGAVKFGSLFLMLALSTCTSLSRSPNGTRTSENSRIASVVNKMMADDDIAFKAELATSGAAKIGALDVASPSDPVLKDCSAIKRLAEKTEHYKERWPQYVQTAKNLGTREVASGAVDPKWVAGFLEGFDTDARRTNFERRWNAEAEGVSKIADLCKTLAHGNWGMQNGRIKFSNASDLAQVKSFQEWAATRTAAKRQPPTPVK